MSDHDLKEVPFNNWYDSKSEFPEMLSVNTTPNHGVNVTSPSVDTHHDWAPENEDSSAMDSAPNMGNSAGNVPLEEMGPHKGGDLI